MPRPTLPQFAYGLLTVVVSALAMLLLSRTGSAVAVAVIAVAAFGLGLLVALTVPRGSAGTAGSPDVAADAGVPVDVATPAASRVAHVADGAAGRGEQGRWVRVP